MRRDLDLENRNRDLEPINQKLRAEAGYLEVNDPANPVVLRLPPQSLRTHLGMESVAAGRKLVPEWYDAGRPAVPKGPSAGPIDGEREVLAYATVRKGRRWLALYDGNCWDGIGNVVDENNWLIRQSPKHAESVDIAGDKGQQASFDQKQPVVLMRLRSRNRAGSKRRLGLKGRPAKEQRWNHGLAASMMKRGQ